MNHVTVEVEEVPPPLWIDSVRRFALKVLNKLKHENWELSILLCGDKTITELNSEFRNKPESTDILSFSLDTEIQENGETFYLPGDIVISLDTLSENARYFKIPKDEELRRLIIHGILHLDGMEHKTLDKSEPMLVLQEKILKTLKDEHIIPTEEQSEKPFST